MVLFKKFPGEIIDLRVLERPNVDFAMKENLN